MPPNGKPLSGQRSSDGFTFVEILAVLLILSVVGLFIWQGSAIATRALATSSTRSFRSARLLQLDEKLRTEVSKIVIPFWELQASVAGPPNSLSIPYYEKNPDAELLIRLADDYISVQTPDSQSAARFGPFTGSELSAAYDDEGAPTGIEFSCLLDNGDRITTLYRFGSFPISRGEK